MLHLVRRRAFLSINNVVLFAAGDDTMLALFGLVGALGAGSVQKIITNAGFLLLFGCWFRWMRKPALFPKVVA